jgi:Tol biopolymer transport system component
MVFKRFIKVLFLLLLGVGSVYATQRVSVDNETILIGDNHASQPVISRDGRFVAFTSRASNLVPNDTNDDRDIFIHDRQTGTIERVVVDGIDSLHINYSSKISMSNDGRYIVFVSLEGLLPNDDNGKYDVYLIDRNDNSLRLVSMRSEDNLVGNDWSVEASISGDGNYIVFNSMATLLLPRVTTAGNIFLYDVQSHQVVWNVTDTDNSAGNGGNGGCRYPRISNDGRYIVFQSFASDLVAGDDNGKRDLFLRGTQRGDPVLRIDARYSTSHLFPTDSSISDDGRYVVFDSELDDLVPNDTNGVTDVFIYDKNDGSISRLNVGGVEGTLAKFGSHISGDGNYITYLSGATPAQQRVYRYNRVDDSVEEISLNSAGETLNDENREAQMSFNGDLIVFATRATNVTPFDTNEKLDIVIRDRNNNSTDIISGHTPRSNDSSGDIVSLSADGRYVAFSSKATNLVPNDTNGKKDIFVRDTKNDTIKRVSFAIDGTQSRYDSTNPSISADGRYVTFESASDDLTTGGYHRIDILLYDCQTGITTLISNQSNHGDNSEHSQSPSISANGKYVVFKTLGALVSKDSNDKVDIYLRNLDTGVTELVSVASDDSLGDNLSTFASISGDGRYVVFESYATNFSSNASSGRYANIFIRDRQSGVTTLVSSAYDGSEANGNSKIPSISEDGNFVVFESTATNLLSTTDTNDKTDIFLYNRLTNTLKRVTNAIDGGESNKHSYLAYSLTISKDGRYIVFRSGASNLVANDTNGLYDAFLYDDKKQTTIRLSMNNSGEQANSGSYAPSISPNGNVASYYSIANNLVVGDNNNRGDVFISKNSLYEKASAASPALIMYLLN